MYLQQLQQDARDCESRPKRTTLPLVSDHLAASPSTDRFREQLDDDSKLQSAQLERAKSLKATAAAPLQQAAPIRRNAEPSTQYGSLHGQYNALFSFPPVTFSYQAPDAPVMAPSLATHTQTHCSPSAAFPPVALASRNSLDSHAPRQPPQRLLPQRRPSTRPPSQSLRSLLPTRLRQRFTPSRNSLRPVTSRR